MSDSDIAPPSLSEASLPPATPARKSARKRATAAPAAASEPLVEEKSADTRVARIKILQSHTPAKGFTFAKGATPCGVPLAHAEYLQSTGQAKILEVSAT